jgi:hypothetical protein
MIIVNTAYTVQNEKQPKSQTKNQKSIGRVRPMLYLELKVQKVFIFFSLQFS